MIEIDRDVTVAHRLLLPFVFGHEATPERTSEIQQELVKSHDALAIGKFIGIRTLARIAKSITSYENALIWASRFSGQNVIGAGLETIVTEVSNDSNSIPDEQRIRKFASVCRMRPDLLVNEMTRRQSVGKSVLGDFMADTTYDTVKYRGADEPSTLAIMQPKVLIVGDAQTDPDFADARAEFKERALFLAEKKGLIVDLVPGHHNLAVVEENDDRVIRLIDTPLLAIEDQERFFLHLKAKPQEELRWIKELAA